MKKKLILLLSLLLILTSIVSCNEVGKTESENIKIVTTIFPIYDWVREIVGENPGNIDISILLDNGVDLHSYKPTADEIIEIGSSDIFIYVGGHSDSWVEGVLEQKTNDDLIAINLVEILGEDVLEEEFVEGMEHDHDHSHDDEDHGHNHDDEDHDHNHDDENHDHSHEDEDHDHNHDDEDHDHNHEDEDHDHNHDDEDHDHNHDDEDHDHNHEDDDHDHHHDHEADEHVWLSLKNARVFSEYIESKLSEIDQDNANIYKKNLENYSKKLSDLDDDYKDIIKGANYNTLIFADRFPFRYLVEDYDIDYYAAFSGCSADSEASFETIAFLAEKTNELDLPAIMNIDGSNSKIAETVSETSAKDDLKILTLDSMQTIQVEDINQGKYYIEVMRENLNVLKEALY